MNKGNPYQISEAAVKDKAMTEIKAHLEKGLSIGVIIESLQNGITACDRKLSRDSFHIESLARKHYLQNKLSVAMSLKLSNHE